MVDLHTHSSASDGTVSPSGIAELADRAGLRAVALTDHDSVEGLDEFLAAASGRPVAAVPGVEIACSWYGASMHLLGLFLDPRSPALRRLLRRLTDARRERNTTMLQRLRELGAQLTWEDVVAAAGGGVIGRPHFAQALVKHGHCQSKSDAFARFLATGRPAYVRRFLPLPAAGIEAVHRAGGIAVWAHPLAFRSVSPSRLRHAARRLKSMGLDALEAFYPDHTPEHEETALRVADETGLLVSGGSDFHGAITPGIEIGSGGGRLRVPDRVFEALKARADGRHDRSDPPDTPRA